MNEWRINRFLTLKLEGKVTAIFVSDKRFQQCKHLFLSIPINNIDRLDEIESIDEAAGELESNLNKFPQISPTEEFWAHCSNLQAFYENNYNTKIHHSNLAFPLLKKLHEEGDPIAKKVFKEEIAKRLSSKYSNTILFLLENNYEFFLTREEFETLYYNLNQEKKELIKRFIVGRFNDEKSDNGLLNNLFEYLEVVCSTQEFKEYQYVSHKEKKYFVRKGKLTISRVQIKKISDINGLSKVKGLKMLTIEYTPINSINGLENLVNLESLSLSRNKIKIVSRLKTLKNLKILDLSFNKIEKISGLEKLSRLGKLYLGWNQIVEINGLKQCGDLKRLELNDNNIAKITGLDTLKNLKLLNLGTNIVVNLDGLSGVKKLNHLILSNNEIKEICGLTDLQKLKTLGLEHNFISEIKGLESLINLESLDLSYNDITEMKGLEGLRKLREINLEKNQIYKVHEIKGYMSLEYVNLLNNKLPRNLNKEYLSLNEIEEKIEKIKKSLYK